MIQNDNENVSIHHKSNSFLYWGLGNMVLVKMLGYNEKENK